MQFRFLQVYVLNRVLLLTQLLLLMQTNNFKSSVSFVYSYFSFLQALLLQISIYSDSGFGFIFSNIPIILCTVCAFVINLFMHAL